jgi:hypothetical protein
MKKLALIALILSFGSAWSQKKVVSRGIILSNSYDEYTTNNFSSPDFTARFLEVLEKELEHKLGDIVMIYPNEGKITFIDPRIVATSLKDAAKPYQDYYRQRTEAKKNEYDYIVEVKIDVSDVFKGKESNLQIVSKVIVKDAAGKNILRNAGHVTANIPTPYFNANNLLIERVELKQNFPLSVAELQDALCKSLSLAFQENNKETVSVAERPTINEYDTFINKAITYRLLAPVNFAKSRFKVKINGFYTITRNRPITVSRIHDNKHGLLNFEETNITDINFGLGMKGIYQRYRLQRNFRIGLDATDIPHSNYFIKGVVQASQGILGTGSLGAVTLNIKRKDEKAKGELNFSNNNPGNNPLSNYNRSLGRVFCPFGKLDGTVEDKHLTVQSSTISMNALEVLINGKLAGLIAHPVTTRKYLGKDKKMIPFVVYVAPALSLEEESLILQAFQFNRLSYLLKDYQDRVANALANRNP